MGASEVTAGFAAIDGLELYYQTRGAGRPLVVIHGALQRARARLEEAAPAPDRVIEPTEPHVRALLGQYIAGF